MVELLTFLVRRSTPLTADEVDTTLVRVGRCDGPLLLDRLHHHQLITSDEVTRYVGNVWSMAEYPDQALSHTRWRELFRLAGYTVDGVPARRPESAVRLYRGSVEERCGDWSWTDSLDVAVQYAHAGIRGRPPGAVWTALVTPEHLLARNTGRDESEYIVDTSRVEIVEFHQ
ncbi:hypothetical protein [Amycolatopsis sp. CA-230715]|uniref:hypothetical protein n=1 Tax=Amycolatopsis sp. CA-230715 TaxID=2745196 RepID=UPI001C00FBD1|nr:hypothetical protein [Amycolatopsis sp. CA-230715]